MVSNSRIVWKYQIFASGRTTINAPQGATALGVSFENGWIYCWLLCDPETPRVDRTLLVLPTGEPCAPAESTRYVGSAHDPGYTLHVFDLGEGVRDGDR